MTLLAISGCCFFLAVVVVSMASCIRIQSVSEAKEEIISRQKRQNDREVSRSSGVFGNETFVFETSCARMELTNIIIQLKNSDAVDWDVDEDISNGTVTISGGENCDPSASSNATTEITVKVNGLAADSKVSEATFTFEFEQDLFNWWISNITLEAKFRGNDTKGSTYNGYLHNQDIGAGRGNAYMCQDQYAFISGYEPNEEQAALLFRNFIVQPFVNQTANNGSAYGELEPCEYAFTIPLWMATVTALIMAVILSLGISMLVSIKTPDRFDDPKTSKLLSVPSE